MKNIIRKTGIYMLILTLLVGSTSLAVMADDPLDGDVMENPWADLFEDNIDGPGDVQLEGSGSNNKGDTIVTKSDVKKALRTSIISSTKKTKKSKKAKIVLKKIRTVKGVKYQIKYAANKKMKKAKIKTFNSNKITLKKLRPKRKYYIKARTFAKASNGKRVYSNWTKKKTIKIKNK